MNLIEHNNKGSDFNLNEHQFLEAEVTEVPKSLVRSWPKLLHATLFITYELAFYHMNEKVFRLGAKHKTSDLNSQCTAY